MSFELPFQKIWIINHKKNRKKETIVIYFIQSLSGHFLKFAFIRKLVSEEKIVFQTNFFFLLGNIIWTSIFRMGTNMTRLCGAKPQLQQLIIQVNSSPSQTGKFSVTRQVQRLNSKPIFQKISPIIFSHAEIESETILPLQKLSRKGDQFNNLISSSCMEERELLSLEEILIQEEKKFEVNRIGVNWQSFVKIKKKNYLEDYVFLKELGKGAYGCVLKVKMKYGGLLRAAKVIKSSLVAKNKTGCEKLFAEILVPIRLDHPNLVKLYEVFQYNRQYVLLMELCEGGDLFTNIRKSRFFSQSKAGHIIRQILSAVNYMHKRNVVHRDLKPQNILIDHESETLKIADFGTAIFFNPNKKLRDVVGTPYYMAPEVISGSYDQKCDVWSCGVILYILLSGSPPFNGNNEKQIMQKIKIKPLQFKSPIWNKRNKVAKDLISKMLNKNPSERPSAQQVLNSEWLSNLPDITTISKQKINQIEVEVIANLKQFHFKNKLKAVVYTFIASQLYSNKDKDNLLRVFKEIDKDGDGVIERNQLVNVFNSHSTSILTQREIEKILSIVDTNGSGQIDFTQFLVAASNQEQLLEQKRLENAFNYLDADHSGFITIEEVKAFLDGTDQTSEEIRQIFNQVDENGDGQISKKEFVSLLLKRN